MSTDLFAMKERKERNKADSAHCSIFQVSFKVHLFEYFSVLWWELIIDTTVQI
jgi:hypothetical protein